MFGRRVAVVACEFDFLAGSIGVAAAERITSAIERATGAATAAAGIAELGRHPHAGGHRRVPADGQDRRRGHPAQEGAPALPGLSAASDHRRGVRVVGFARPHHRRRAGRADRFPRPAGLRTAVRRAVSGRRADRREPAAARRHRRCGAARRAAPHPGLGAESGRRPSRRAARAAAARTDARRAGLGVGRGLAPTRPPRRRATAAVRRHRTGVAVRHRAGRGRDDAARTGPLRRSAGGGAGSATRVVGGMVGPAALREARRGHGAGRAA